MHRHVFISMCVAVALLPVGMTSRTTFADGLLAPVMAPEAKRYLDAGLKLFDAGKLGEAIVQLRLALSVQRHPDILYALGQAERKHGDCDKAVPHFKAAAEFELSNVAREAVRIQIERCEPDRSPNAAAAQPQTLVVPERPAVPVSTVSIEQRDSSRSSVSWLGHALTAGGVLALASGTIVYVQARSTVEDADLDYGHHRAALAARTRGHLGLAVAGTGVALIIGGVVRYLTHHDSPVDVAIDTTGPARGSLFISGSF